MKKLFKKTKIAFAIYFVSCVLWILIQYGINKHNMYNCYKNIGKIEIGDDINDALMKMKKGLIFEKVFFSIYSNDRDTINSNCYIEVKYPYLDNNDATSGFPCIYFSVRTI